jgi:hypothetical protein
MYIDIPSVDQVASNDVNTDGMVHYTGVQPYCTSNTTIGEVTVWNQQYRL